MKGVTGEMNEPASLVLSRREPYAPRVELVERKGLGHPDMMCDHLAESLARRLSQAMLERTGAVQHFNVDKGLLVAGAVDVAFGGGRHVEPAHIILAGRVDLRRWSIDLDELHGGLCDDLSRLLPDAQDGAFQLGFHLHPPSQALAALTSANVVPIANDTSFAAVSLPRSPLEQLVHGVEHHLTSSQLHRLLPIGPDVKVMGLRNGNDVVLIVAAAVLAERVQSLSDYTDAVDAVAAEVRTLSEGLIGRGVHVAVNCADAGAPYLTLSGTSAEAGDDGQVGRGNRFGGLITPYRRMSMEATAGKHPTAHVGKTYHCVAHDIATRVLAETAAREVTVTILSRIGSTITEPEALHIETCGEVSSDAARAIASECLADWVGVRDRLIAGAYPLF